MKTIAIKILCLAIVSMSLLACKKLKTSDAEIERTNWIAGFNDSIKYYSDQNKELQEKLEKLNNEISEKLAHFQYIKNPKEVSGYYLMEGWQEKLPMKTTGIYARINENEKLELIATLSGATFNQLAAGVSSPQFYSDVVPHDQAFNFRHEKFNTVYFSSGKADTIAEFISENKSEKLNLYFLQGKTVKDFRIPEKESQMIAGTWNIYKMRQEARNLQKELWINSRKIDTFRRILDESNLSSNQ